MRSRDMRAGMHVYVRANATGDAIDVRGQVGTITHCWNGSATVRFPDLRARDVESRWLTPHEGPPSPPDSEELAAFKEKVAEVASEYGHKYNMCDVLDEALAELGITPKPPALVRIVLEIPENEFDDYRDGNSEPLLEGIQDYIGDVLRDAYSSERAAWTKSAEFVTKKDGNS